LILLGSDVVADDDDHVNAQSQFVTSGQTITPTAAPGSVLQYLNPHLLQFPHYIASGGISSAKSPDGKTLLILTAGYNNLDDSAGNLVPAASQQYVFVFDISGGTPVEKQVLTLPNTYVGIAFHPNGQSFYVGGGVNDNVHIFTLQHNSQWAETSTPISLGHKQGVGLVSDGLAATAGQDPPVTGGVAVTADGTELLVTNVYNDSVSLVNLMAGQVQAELDLRPGKINPAQTGVPGGEYPFWVVIKGSTLAYISSIRDREVDVVGINAGQLTLLNRIKVNGNPNKMILDKQQARLFVAEDNSDQIDVIDTGTNRIINTIQTAGPKQVIRDLNIYHGVVPDSLALSPTGQTLYVTNGGTNSVAIIQLSGLQAQVVGLIPTGYYPNAVEIGNDGRTLYVLNGKSPTGPDPGYFPKGSVAENASNQYIEKDEKSSLLSFPVPDEQTLDRLTRTVAANNGFGTTCSDADSQVMHQLHDRILHVIYVIKENRTYDQVLGDLDRGNGDPAITEFGAAITPSQHKLADYFVDLDNFYDSGDVSANGWPWSTSGRESDFGTKSVPLNYGSSPTGGGRGTDYEYEGTNREINIGLSALSQRLAADPATPTDPNILPGTANVAAPDGPGTSAPQGGYIWDAALRAGLSVRDYGAFCDLTRYSAPANTPLTIPEDPDPYQSGTQVAYVDEPELLNRFDPYFRGFDNAFPDYYRELEWEREFDIYDQNGQLPSLEIVRIMHDHTGNFSTAIDGVNTIELQQADNDYALGRLVDRVAHSQYKYNTLIFALEDDAQDGADHVDAHRSIAFVAGPYVKHGAIVSERYTTVNVLRTIEDILGTQHLDIYTATQQPMAAVFDLNQRDWDFKAVASAYLANTQLPIPSSAYAAYKSIPHPTHDAAYWAEKTKEFDFRKARSRTRIGEQVRTFEKIATCCCARQASSGPAE
jgi:DNA-binding beta-propeller fold protein YncE